MRLSWKGANYLLFLWWVLLKNSIRVLNHRQKNIAFSVGVCIFFSPQNTKSFSLSWKRETFARFVLGRRSRRHKKGSILSRLQSEFRINVCSVAAATMEKVHTSIKMSACEFLWTQSSSNACGFSLHVQNVLKLIVVVITEQNTVFLYL